MTRYAMVVDLDRCTGCRACMEACKVENNTPQGIFWMYVFRLETGEYPNVQVSFLPRPCMHCEAPPCTQVCPVGATYKDERGRVVVDAQRCIGCRYCVQACPYGVRYSNDKDPKRNYYLDWESPEAEEVARVTEGSIPPYSNPDLDQLYPVGLPQFEGQMASLAGGGRLKGVVEKCNFCLQRVAKDLLPVCVTGCPVRALHFGDLDDPNSEVSLLLAEKPYFQLLGEFGTQPKVFYRGGQPPGEETRQIEAVSGRV